MPDQLPKDSPSLLPNALDRRSMTPIYHQLFVLLRDQILSGQWKAGELIPPEPALMKTYQVSRITVRQAVEKLTDVNLVVKQRGKGTYVNLPAVHSESTHLIGFEKDMRQRGHVPETRLLASSIESVSRVTADQLQMHVGDELVYIRRLHLADSTPISAEDIFLVHRFCPGILNKYNFANESITDAWETGYGLRIDHAEQTVSAMIAPKGIRELLHVSGEQALLYIERISYSQSNTPLEMRHIYFRADRYALQMKLTR